MSPITCLANPKANARKFAIVKKIPYHDFYGKKPDHNLKECDDQSEILDTTGDKITRIVSMLTSHIRARNIRIGRITLV
jgi:hypothetical protein